MGPPVGSVAVSGSGSGSSNEPSQGLASTSRLSATRGDADSMQRSSLGVESLSLNSDGEEHVQEQEMMEHDRETLLRKVSGERQIAAASLFLSLFPLRHRQTV